jgi:hypothetical protein
MDEYCPISGKKKFESKGDATRVLVKPKNVPHYDGKRVKRRMNKRKEVRTYHCTDCDCWHLTSKDHYKKEKSKHEKK